MKESDNYDIFTENNRSEFLFRVFTHITLGGPINQVRALHKPVLLTCQTSSAYLSTNFSNLLTCKTGFSTRMR